MNTKFLLWFLLGIGVLMSSCSKDETEILPESELPMSVLTVSDFNTISYFKDIALGIEFGDATEITRKWDAPMRIFIDGNTSPFLINKVE